MSIDLLSAHRAHKATAQKNLEDMIARHGEVHDLIVLFGGWGSNDAGRVLPEDGTSGPATLIGEIRTLQVSRPLKKVAFQGSLFFDSGVSRAEAFILDNFHPLGKIIVYGYSAGGASAMKLVWSLDQSFKYYNLATRSFSAWLPFDSLEQWQIGIIRVDLLITVDAALGPVSKRMNRRIPMCVRKNVNFYQPYPSSRIASDSFGIQFLSGVHSHGGPSLAHSPNATEIRNINLSKEFIDKQGYAHGQIDDLTVPKVMRLIRQELKAHRLP